MDLENTNQSQAPLQSPTQNQSLSPKDQSRHSKKIIIVSAIIVALFAFGAGGYFLGTNKNKINYGSQQIVVSPPVTQPSSTNNLIPTENSTTVSWKTYTNAKFGYSLKYPADRYQVDEFSSKDYPDLIHEACFVNIGSEGGCEITLLITLQSMDDYLKGHTGDGTYRHVVSDYTLDSLKANWVEYRSIPRDNELIYIEAIVKKGDQLFALNTTAGSQYPYEKIFKQILSTFKFTR